MNIQYIKNRAKVFVTNENGEIRKVTNTDNIEEKLVKENELEVLTTEISEKKLEIKAAKERYRFNLILDGVVLIIVTAISFPTLFEISNIPYIILLSTFVVGEQVEAINELKRYNKILKFLQLKKSEINSELKELEASENIVYSNREIVKEVSSDSIEQDLDIIDYYAKKCRHLKRLYKKDKLNNFFEKNNTSEFNANYITKLLEEDIFNDKKYMDDSLEKNFEKGFSKRKK